MKRTLLEIFVAGVLVSALLYGVWVILTPNEFEQIDLRYFDSIDNSDTEKIV